MACFQPQNAFCLPGNLCVPLFSSLLQGVAKHISEPTPMQGSPREEMPKRLAQPSTFRLFDSILPRPYHRTENDLVAIIGATNEPIAPPDFPNRIGVNIHDSGFPFEIRAQVSRNHFDDDCRTVCETYQNDRMVHTHLHRGRFRQSRWLRYRLLSNLRMRKSCTSKSSV